MYRWLYALGLAYVAACAALLYIKPRPVAMPIHVEAATPVASPGEWFARIRPFCNPVEVEVRLRQDPAPAGFDGIAYSAACLALAGKVDRARALINSLAESERSQAAGVVFEVAHPVADAGDDRAAGPIMEMVIEYWPNHYMALYHAGMSEYALGQPALARKNLREFLRYYNQNDGWRRNALETLDRLGP
jgi:hypothetical protein